MPTTDLPTLRYATGRSHDCVTAEDVAALFTRLAQERENRAAADEGRDPDPVKPYTRSTIVQMVSQSRSPRGRYRTRPMLLPGGRGRVEWYTSDAWPTRAALLAELTTWFTTRPGRGGHTHRRARGGTR